MSLTVLSIAFPFAPVGPQAVGGAEQILGALDRALVSRGHTSLVAACEGSQPAGKLFSVPVRQRETLKQTDRAWTRSQFQAAIDRALSSHQVDLIHMHGLDFHEYAVPSGIPTLVTLHLPLAWYPAAVWKTHARRVQFCCVSESQRASCPPELRDLPVVENGVPLYPFAEAKPKGDYALVLGRICPEKNAHAALEAGNRAHTRVLLGGQIFPYREHWQYFEDKIEPLLGHPEVKHEFLGVLPPVQRQQMLQRARCLLHPTLAPETSSLVAMEALAAGTPVIAYRSGALPEIVEHGVTGFLVEDAEQMAEAIRNADTLSPTACREAAERRFSGEAMVQRYFYLYEELLDRDRGQKLYA